MFGNRSQVVPRVLAIGLKLLDLARDLVPVGLGASTQATNVRVQVRGVLALLQYDRTQVLQERVLVDGVLDLGHARQVVELKAVHVARVEEVADLAQHSNDVLECPAPLELFHAHLQVHEMLRDFL